ncbi:MAG: hypothetical protein EA374_05525 [Acholeplasmatales bacterium]|nr:MAG: hypothetical protein EA374_05525 [Acholeplasmatales bacterium]
MMKRLITLVLTILFVIGLTACRSVERTRFQAVLDEIEAAWTLEGVDRRAIVADVFLLDQSTVESDALITWSSDTPAFLSATGRVIRPAFEPEIVTLSVTITLENLAPRTYTYTFLVLPLASEVTVTFVSEPLALSIVVAFGAGQVITPPDFPESPAYTFGGWRILGTDTLFDFSTPIDADLILEAVLIDTTYTVTFDALGGGVFAPITDVIHSTTLEVLPIPSRPGYTFVGWIFIDAFGNEQELVAGKTIINHDIEAFALWAESTS